MESVTYVTVWFGGLCRGVVTRGMMVVVRGSAKVNPGRRFHFHINGLVPLLLDTKTFEVFRQLLE
jgi:hypothetical protein